MHICVLPHLFPARSETFVREHVVGMAKRGHRITVIARSMGSDISPNELSELDALGIQRIYLGEYPSTLKSIARAGLAAIRHPSLFNPLRHPLPWSRQELLTAISAANWIKRLDPTILHYHFGNHAARLLRVAPMLPALPPMLVTWHGYDANAIPRQLGNNVYHDLFETDAHHTVGSTFMRNRLQTLGARDESLSQVPMGIDLQKFAFRERLIGGGGPLRVLSVGRLEEVKGHEFLIKASSLLLARGIELDLRIIGGGRLKDKIERQIIDAGLERHVKLLGALPSRSVVEEMHGAHVFALTGIEEESGKVESQGLVYAEAQATGLPAVGSDAGGVPETIIHGETGIICRPGDPSSIADALEHFAHNPMEIARYGKQARRLVENRYSIESMLDRFEAIYSEMAHQ